MRFLVALVVAVLPFTLLASNADSLVFSNGNVIVGEIKSLDLGVLVMKTSYSDSDFKIEWSGVRRIFTTSMFLVTLENGERYTARLQSADDGHVSITTGGGDRRMVLLQEVVYLKEVEQTFLSRLYANVDVGYSLTKAQSQNQLTVNTRLGYLADLFTLDTYYNDLFSSQDSVIPIRRTDFGAGVRYLLPADWYLSLDASFLSNTEQALRLRSNLKVGAGKFMIHSNQLFWSIGVGTAGNLETFSNNVDPRQSLEAYLGTEVNFFNFGDLNLLLNVYAYPSLTERGRLRTDGRFDVKYDLPLDLYVRAGVTVNYDNQPAISGRQVDYVFTTGLGWEW